MRTTILFSFLALTLLSCRTKQNVNASEFVGNSYNSKIKLDSLTLLDSSRNREIPLAIYSSKSPKDNQEIIIFSHGYGGNKLGENLQYPYLTKALAAHNYYVVSVQQELPSDPPIPLTGNIQVVRRPSWEKGADNIFFVINELKQRNPNLNFSKITLIGHSQGGDMSALFQEKYPNVVNKIITMDNRRMALPRSKHPKIYSLRASEFEADQGVIPTLEEQEKLDIKIVYLDAKHSDMGGSQGTIKQKKEYISLILSFLKE